MSIYIVAIYIVIVVFPISCSSIVRGIDIDTIHLATMGFLQQIESLEIITLNDKVPRKRFVLAQAAFWIGGQYGNIFLQQFVNSLGMFFPNKTVLLITQMVFNLVEGANGSIIRMLFLELLKKGNHIISFDFRKVCHYIALILSLRLSISS